MFDPRLDYNHLCCPWSALYCEGSRTRAAHIHTAMVKQVCENLRGRVCAACLFHLRRCWKSTYVCGAYCGGWA